MADKSRQNTTIENIALPALFLVQFVCMMLLAYDVAIDLTGQDGKFKEQEWFEYIAVFVLIFSLIATFAQFYKLRQRNKAVENQLKAASGAFSELLKQYFDEWDLTTSEQDVALLAIKGFAISEIANIRAKKEGTVKAQLNAIYKKAGVSGRPQLISLFIEELMDEGLTL